MCDELVLVTPTLEHKQQAINLIVEVSSTDIDPNFRFAGFAHLDEYRYQYPQWLERIQNNTSEYTVPEGHVPANTFFAVRKSDGKIVGIIDVRHRLNDYMLKYAGHIGYTVLPSERRKGYGYQQLMLALEFCKSIGINRALLVCNDYNLASARTIEKAGGILENKIMNSSGQYERRYWIELK